MRDARCPPAFRKQDPQVYLLFDVKCFSYLSLIYLSYRIPKSTKWSSEIHPESFKMGAKIGPKKPLGAALGGSKGLLGGILGGPRDLLEGSWGVSGGFMGFIRQPSCRGVNCPRPFWSQETPLDPPRMEPKLIKIGFKSHPKGDHFFDRSLDRLLERFGANLAPPPKPSQNGAKLGPKSVQVEVLI